MKTEVAILVLLIPIALGIAECPPPSGPGCRNAFYASDYGTQPPGRTEELGDSLALSGLTEEKGIYGPFSDVAREIGHPELLPIRVGAIPGETSSKYCNAAGSCLPDYGMADSTLSMNKYAGTRFARGWFPRWVDSTMKLPAAQKPLVVWFTSGGDTLIKAAEKWDLWPWDVFGNCTEFDEELLRIADKVVRDILTIAMTASMAGYPTVKDVGACGIPAIPSDEIMRRFNWTGFHMTCVKDFVDAVNCKLFASVYCMHRELDGSPTFGPIVWPIIPIYLSVVQVFGDLCDPVHFSVDGLKRLARVVLLQLRQAGGCPLLPCIPSPDYSQLICENGTFADFDEWVAAMDCGPTIRTNDDLMAQAEWILSRMAAPDELKARIIQPVDFMSIAYQVKAQQYGEITIDRAGR